MDRVVLNAYFPLGHSPGGFRTWWQRWHGGSDAQLDDAHLMRLPGRFARRVRAWAKANGVPVIECKAGQREHQIADLRGHGRRPVQGRQSGCRDGESTLAAVTGRGTGSGTAWA